MQQPVMLMVQRSNNKKSSDGKGQLIIALIFIRVAMIRENGLLDDVRIVALSGYSSACYAAALDAGCNDCLVKPFDLQRLKDYLVPFPAL